MRALRASRRAGRPARLTGRQLAQLRVDERELNPVEGLWASLKSQDLANHACRSTKELAATARLGSFRARRDQQLPAARCAVPATRFAMSRGVDWQTDKLELCA